MQKLLSNAKLPSQLLTSVEEVVSFTNTAVHWRNTRLILLLFHKTWELVSFLASNPGAFFFDDLKPRMLLGFLTLILESYYSNDFKSGILLVS